MRCLLRPNVFSCDYCPSRSRAVGLLRAQGLGETGEIGEQIRERPKIGEDGDQVVYRLVVNYRAEADGSLVPCGPPSGREAASGEALLYRKLARLVDAEPAAIAALASRLGPLGPTGPIATLADERTMIWQLGEVMAAFVDTLDELDPWIEVGGSITIPGRLSGAANMVAASPKRTPS